MAPLKTPLRAEKGLMARGWARGAPLSSLALPSYPTYGRSASGRAPPVAAFTDSRGSAAPRPTPTQQRPTGRCTSCRERKASKRASCTISKPLSHALYAREFDLPVAYATSTYIVRVDLAGVRAHLYDVYEWRSRSTPGNLTKHASKKNSNVPTPPGVRSCTTGPLVDPSPGRHIITK